MSAPLAICTPTRRRWPFLLRQAAALAPQLHPDDRWIIAIDNDDPDPRYADRIREVIGDRLLVWLHFAYERPEPPAGVINRLRNAAAAFAPPEANIVELDDDGPIFSDALSEIRHGFEAGYDFIFGWHKTVRLLEAPGGEILLEPGPDHRPWYEPGAFVGGDCEPSGVRGIRRDLWDRLGGWRADAWPDGHVDFAIRAEAEFAAVLCLEKPLCEVTLPLEHAALKPASAKPV